jgi:hypothetical protein
VVGGWSRRRPPLVPRGGLLDQRSQGASCAAAKRIWDTINGPTLAQNVLPTRSRATLVLRKQ